MGINDGGPAFPVLDWITPERVETCKDGMTLRQYAAIKLRVPKSGDEWLDDMILDSLRDELAAKAMQGICASGPGMGITSQVIASEAYEIADAMLDKREQFR